MGGNSKDDETAELQIVPIRAFRDNDIWCLRAGGRAAVVDPGAAQPVLEDVETERLSLAAILCTHHDANHVGGVAGLLARFRVPAYGPAHESIPTLTMPLSQGDKIRVEELGADFVVLDTPGHTAGHIAYYGGKLLFCGDTLFNVRSRPFVRRHAGANVVVAVQARRIAGRHAHCPKTYWCTAAVNTRPPNIRFAGAVNPSNEPLHQPMQVFAALRDWKNRF